VILINILFAAGVARDTGAITARGENTILVGAMTWIVATLLGGVFSAAIYWTMHHSILRNRTDPDDPSAPGDSNEPAETRHRSQIFDLNDRD
jgi:phosphate/sulfate permease